MRASMFDDEVTRFAAFLAAHPYQPASYPQALTQKHSCLGYCGVRLATAVGLLAAPDGAWQGTPTQRLARIHELAGQFTHTTTRVRDLFEQWLDPNARTTPS
jgi:hypothetical protein